MKARHLFLCATVEHFELQRRSAEAQGYEVVTVRVVGTSRIGVCRLLDQAYDSSGSATLTTVPLTSSFVPSSKITRT